MSQGQPVVNTDEVTSSRMSKAFERHLKKADKRQKKAAKRDSNDSVVYSRQTRELFSVLAEESSKHQQVTSTVTTQTLETASVKSRNGATSVSSSHFPESSREDGAEGLKYEEAEDDHNFLGDEEEKMLSGLSENIHVGRGILTTPSAKNVNNAMGSFLSSIFPTAATTLTRVLSGEQTHMKGTTFITSSAAKTKNVDGALNEDTEGEKNADISANHEIGKQPTTTNKERKRKPKLSPLKRAEARVLRLVSSGFLHRHEAHKIMSCLMDSGIDEEKLIEEREERELGKTYVDGKNSHSVGEDDNNSSIASDCSETQLAKWCAHMLALCEEQELQASLLMEEEHNVSSSHKTSATSLSKRLSSSASGFFSSGNSDKQKKAKDRLKAHVKEATANSEGITNAWKTQVEQERSLVWIKKECSLVSSGKNFKPLFSVNAKKLKNEKLDF